jgi:hypothetical protein
MNSTYSEACVFCTRQVDFPFCKACGFLLDIHSCHEDFLCVECSGTLMNLLHERRSPAYRQLVDENALAGANYRDPRWLVLIDEWLETRRA